LQLSLLKNTGLEKRIQDTGLGRTKKIEIKLRITEFQLISNDAQPGNEEAKKK